MHPNPGIVYKTLGGVLDMYFFLGPTPELTAQQYSEVSIYYLVLLASTYFILCNIFLNFTLQAVGRFPLPPYWALGFHLCRHMYNTIENLKATVDRMIASEIPYVCVHLFKNYF